MKILFVGVLLGVAAIPAGAGQPDPLSIRVSPNVAFAPANLVVRASIATDADNRTVEIVAESEDFYRSSEIQLEGDRAPHMTMFEFRNLPSGNYEIKATLRGSAGRERAIARKQVNVVASSAGH